MISRYYLQLCFRVNPFKIICLLLFQIKSSLVRLIVCFGLYFLVQTLTPKVLAIKRSSDIEEYMIGEQRTRRRQNYVEQMGLENVLFENIDDVGPPYDTKISEPEISKEELPELIVDYANMIRNDIILLDNSVETRTRKRGNIKVEKHNVSETTANKKIYTLRL